MDFTVYLPEELGQRVRDAGLPRGTLSQLLQTAVSEELERREAMSKTLEKVKEHKLELEDENGDRYAGRLVGREIAADEGTERTVYLTEDERVILYDPREMKHWDVSDDLEDALSELSTQTYVSAMRALGEKPTIDI